MTEPTDTRRRETRPDKPGPGSSPVRMPTLAGPNSVPPMVRFLISHALVGFGLAAAFVAALIGFDVGNVGTVLRQSGIAVPATLLLTFVLGLTFASVQMGIAIMTGNTPEGPDDKQR
ncbi:MAG: hypothetical protein ACFB01_01325 [Cohaesibacteraceae bacterium]